MAPWAMWMASLALAGGAPAPVDATVERVDLAPHLVMRMVPEGGPGWPAVLEEEFVPPRRGMLNMGLSSDTWWARFTVHNGGSVAIERWLALEHATLDDVVLYDGNTPRKPCGLVHPLENRELRRPTCAFRIQLAPGESRELVMAVRSENELTLPMVLSTLEAMLQRDVARMEVRALLWGVILAMALVNLFLFLFTRERVYLSYACGGGFVVSWAVFLVGGFHMIPGAHQFPRLPFLVASQGFTLCSWWFMRHFLRLPTERPDLDRRLRLIPLSLPVALATWMLAGWRVQNAVGLAIGLAIALAGFWVGVRRWRDGHEPAKYFAAAWLSYVMTYVLANALLAGAWAAPDPMLVPLLAATSESVFLAVAIASDSHRQAESVRALQRASTRFVPFRFLDLLGHRALPEVRHGEHVSRTMTVWFSDLRAFTTLAEGLSPEKTMELVNTYLARVEPIITQHGGVVDKYIGDAVMALFETPEAAFRAARAAVKDLESVPVGQGARVRMGVGLHTGPLVLGVVGSPERLACTVLGDSVNLASRVEGLTRTYDVEVLCTGATRAACADPAAGTLRELDSVRVKGKNDPVVLWQLVEAEAERVATDDDGYARGLEHYRAGGFSEAEAEFHAFARRHPGDRPASVLHARCVALRRDPPPAWDGVFTLDHK